MWGEVEIYAGDKLISKESNMLVDGASELLAHIMTLSPSLSGIGIDEGSVGDPATSSILDASNYTIQAISFGTARSAYTDNAHANSADKAYLLSSTFGKTSAVVAVMANPNTSAIASPSPDVPPTILGSTSSYTPLKSLPHYSDPSLPTLEVSSDVSAFGGLGDATISSILLSSLVPGNGQNLNLIPSAYHQAVFTNTSMSSVSSICASLIGCWPAGSSVGTAINGTEFSAFSAIVPPNANNANRSFQASDVAYSGAYSGVFNEASSMDTSGFVTMTMSGGYQHPNSDPEASSIFSGLCISGGETALMRFGFLAGENPGVVEYSVLMGAGDVGCANLYGGIYNMGLWTIDMDKSLQGGNTPPYAFDPLNNPRRYKLFATKTFTKNLGFIEDYNDGNNATVDAGSLNYTDLTIKWRLHFI